MPTYDYKCEEHGYFEKHQKIAERASAECPQCGATCPQKIHSIAKHGLDLEAMSRIGMPGAWESVGDRITKRHKSVAQHHRPVGRD